MPIGAVAPIAAGVGGGKGFALPALSIGNVLSGIGSGIAAMAARNAGLAAQNQANLQAELYNREATQKRQQSEADAELFRRRQSALQGSLRARVGGQGVTFEGTPLMVAEDLASEGELQRLRILHGGIADESRLRFQGDLAGFQGAAARRQGNLRAGASLLKGAGQLFGQA